LAQIAARGQSALAVALSAEVRPDWAAHGMRLLAEAQSRTRADAPTRAIVVHVNEQRVIGDVRFEPVSQERVEIGYEIVPDFRRQGYATEASARVIQWLFDEAGAQLVIAGCTMKNRASVRTLRKLGFLLDGTTRRGAFWWVMTKGMLRTP
jgi:RimJ/RimL family protein N-acetyltransferase